MCRSCHSVLPRCISDQVGTESIIRPGKRLLDSLQLQRAPLQIIHEPRHCRAYYTRFFNYAENRNTKEDSSRTSQQDVPLLPEMIGIKVSSSGIEWTTIIRCVLSLGAIIGYKYLRWVRYCLPIKI